MLLWTWGTAAILRFYSHREGKIAATIPKRGFHGRGFFTLLGPHVEAEDLSSRFLDVGSNLPGF